ncbi:MAG: hypothetical protein ACI35K_04315, partial [Campylobacter sp.]
EFPASLREGKATEARNSSFCLNSSFLLRIRWLGVRGYFLDFYSFRNSKFPVILGLDPRISIWNSRIFLGNSRTA